MRRAACSRATCLGVAETGVAPTSRILAEGRTTIEWVDPGLKLGFIREVTARIEREILPSVNVETALVWRGQRQPALRQIDSQTFSAFIRVVPVTDAGVDGVVGTPDDRAMVVYDLPEKPRRRPARRGR